MQRVTDFESERVTGTETARFCAAADDGVPERQRIFGGTHQLDAELARVARPVDHDLDPVELAHRPGEGFRVGQAEALDRARPLHRKQRVLVGEVPYVGAADLALLEPAVVRITIRRVDD